MLMAYFAIDGVSVIDLKIAPLLVLSFNLPPVTPASFFSTNLVSNLAALLGVSTNMIRRVTIISAANNTYVFMFSFLLLFYFMIEFFFISRVRRATSDIGLGLELREDPSRTLTLYNTALDQAVLDLTTTTLNNYQSGTLQSQWAALPTAGNTSPTGLTVQEPFSQTTDDLKVISRISLVTEPSSCREQSPCTQQPVIVAYDSAGKIIPKLGSINQPWKIVASLVGQPGAFVPGAVANYSNNQSQYSLFGFPSIGTYQVQFTLVPSVDTNT